MKVAIIGSNGQLGQDLVAEFTSQNYEVVELRHKDIEISDIDSVNGALQLHRPQLVINTAAYHNVSLCESSPDIARAVNVEGSKNVSQVAREIGAKTVFISTDFVFDGFLPSGNFNKVSDRPAPINTYGETKYFGEQQALEVDARNLVFRISSVFGKAGSSGKGANFIEAILAKTARGEVAEVIDDTLMSPTYTKRAASILHTLLSIGAEGIQHGSSIGQCSWFELASFAAHKVGRSNLVIPVKSSLSQSPRRPINSSLDTSCLTALGVVNEEWRESVTNYLFEKGHC